MKRLPIISLLTLLACVFVGSCNSDDDKDLNDKYADWRVANDAWLVEQQARTNPDGSKYFTTLVPNWNPSAYVLIHYFNDRKETEGNLSPLLTSTIDTRYIVHYYNGTPMDSSYNQTTYGPGIFRTTLNQVIEGWTIAFTDMRVGDTAEIVIPAASAYGTGSSTVPPYSCLKFNVRLVDIPGYEILPQ